MIPPAAGLHGRPLKFLVGFEKVELEIGHTATVSFPLHARDLTLVNSSGVRGVVHGEWYLAVEGALSSFCI